MPDFAVGLPRKYRKGNITDLQPDTFYTLVQQLHRARRAGKHVDLRIGNEAGLQSWALRKGLPEQPGEKRLGIKQPIHRYSYKDFVGRIPSGYGEGTVDKLEESKVIVLKASPNHLMFTRGNTKDAPIYDMVNTGGDSWLVSIRRENEPPIVQTWKKEHFKSVPMEKVPDLIDAGAAVSSKIDGAGILAYLGKHGIEAYGIRPDKEGKHPRYTDVVGGLRSFKVPPELNNTLLRGELYGVDAHGKVIHPNQLAALLNSTLANAVDKKQKTGTRLLIAALAVNKNGVDDYTADVKSITDKLNHPAIHTIPMYKGDAAKKLVSAISKGQYPLTREGVVLHQPGKRPLKSKNKEDFDARIEGIFPADTKGVPRAGGFIYSLPDKPYLRARVGTGFSHDMLKDMLANPDNYIGRTARLTSQEQLPSGALRAPSFLAMKED